MKKSIAFILVTVLVLSLALAGCGGKPPATQGATKPAEQQKMAEEQNSGDKAADQSKPAETKITEYKQSPVLDSMGLSPVKDRLPKEPKLPNEMPPDLLTYEIGTYGGALRTVTSAVD